MNKTLESEINQLHAEICAGLADPNRIMLLYSLSQSRTQCDRTLQRIGDASAAYLTASESFARTRHGHHRKARHGDRLQSRRQTIDRGA